MKDGQIDGGVDTGSIADSAPSSQGDFDHNGTDDVLWQNHGAIVSTWLLMGMLAQAQPEQAILVDRFMDQF